LLEVEELEITVVAAEVLEDTELLLLESLLEEGSLPSQ
jgi:hypothetical protein